MAQKTIYTSKEQQAVIDRLRELLKQDGIVPVDRLGHETDSALVHWILSKQLKEIETKQK